MKNQLTKHIEKVTIFSTKPVNGKFKYNDLLLQSSDLDNEEYYTSEIIFTIETNEPYFRYSTNNRDILSKKIIEIEFLLSLFSQFYFFDFIKSESPLLEYSEKSINEIQRGKIKWYQDKSIDDRNITEVIFPEQMELLFDKYFSLQSREKEFFRKAISLFYTSISIKTQYPSLSLLSLVTSIETMAQIEFEKENKQITECHNCHTVKSSLWTCEKCSAPLWGISKKYKLFLTRYCFKNAPTDSDNKFLNKIYNYRSKIVHFGDVLSIDDFWNDDNWNWDESFAHKDLLNITRMGLLNWLLARN